jgi:hypothetical protein
MLVAWWRPNDVLRRLSSRSAQLVFATLGIRTLRENVSVLEGRGFQELSSEMLTGL